MRSATCIKLRCDVDTSHLNKTEGSVSGPDSFQFVIMDDRMMPIQKQDRMGNLFRFDLDYLRPQFKTYQIGPPWGPILSVTVDWIDKHDDGQELKAKIDRTTWAAFVAKMQSGTGSDEKKLRSMVKLASQFYLQQTGKAPGSANELVPAFFSTPPVNPKTKSPFTIKISDFNIELGIFSFSESKIGGPY